MTIIDKKKANQIVINIESLGDDPCEPEELERITYNLRDDLTELDSIKMVDLVTKEVAAPNHSKAGGEVVTLGSLLITVGGSVASSVIPNLANTLQSWLTRHERRTISLEIGGDKLQLSGVSDKDQERLIDAWISRHSK